MADNVDNSVETVTYQPLPIFGKAGKITVNCAPDGSGKESVAYSPVQAGASSFSSPTSIGGGGGGGGYTTPSYPSQPTGDNPASGYDALRVEICIDGVVQTYDILAKPV